MPPTQIRPATARQQSAELRPQKALEKGLSQVEGQPGLQDDQATTGNSGTEVSRASQELAWGPGSSYCANGPDHQDRKDFFHRLAETVRSKRWASRSGDVCSAFGTPSCKNWRYPQRNLDLPEQTVSVLPPVRAIRQEAAILAVACVPLGVGGGAA